MYDNKIFAGKAIINNTSGFNIPARPANSVASMAYGIKTTINILLIIATVEKFPKI